MSTYDHFTFYSDGSESFIRSDADTGKVTRFLIAPDGVVETAEFDSVDPDGNVINERRLLRDDTLSDEVQVLELNPPNVPGAPVELTDNDDAQAFGDANDDIRAKGGNDTIDAGNGHNIVYAWTGNDTVTSGNQSDIILGGDGEDTVRSGSKGDWLMGGGGDDTLYGNGGNDVLAGGSGDDYMNGGIGDDIVYDIYGDNRIFAGDGQDFVITGAGADYIKADAGDDIVQAGDGRDKIYGGGGNDNINAGADADIARGDDGNDVIDGGLGNDILYGGIGNDILNGFGDSDTVYGEDGNDTLFADGSSAATGFDNLWGGRGNDTLWGGNGTDHLYGEAGDDILVGTAQGKAIMRGGDGHDTFAFTGINDGSMHVIYDYGAGDVLNVSDALTGFTASSNIDDFVRLSVVDSTRANVLINADGVGTGFRSLVALMGDYTGQTVDSLAASGRLVADHPLFASDT
jgi:Ca2+-binding RTX toxin-like protein